MYFRVLTLALLGSTATAQTQVDWVSSISASTTEGDRAVCFDVPGRTVYSALSTTPSWHGLLRCVDEQGQTIWTVQPQVGSTPIMITSIAYDGNGRIAAAGLAKSPSNVIEGAHVVVYDLAGNPIWSAAWAGPNGEPWNSVRVAGFASLGPVLAGTMPAVGSGNRELGAVAFDAGGALRWSWTAASADDEYLLGAALDSDDEIYLVGLASDPTSFAESGFATKVTAAGATAWSVRRADDFYSCVAVDAQDRPHVAGSRADYSLLLMASLDPSTGQELHAHTMTSSGESAMAAIVIAPNGDVVASGSRYSNIVGTHAFTIALDANGAERWRAAHRPPPPGVHALGTAIDVDSAGDVAIAGWEIDQSQVRRPFVVKYPRSIAPLVGWVSTAAPVVPAPAQAYAFGVRLDEDLGVRAFGSNFANGVEQTVTWRLRPSARTVCVGDGSASACPCGNESAPFERAGCASSFGLGGKLEWSGVPSIAADTLRLTASALPASTTALFLQGAGAATPGVTFGDGIACIGAPIVRLGTRTANTGRAVYPVTFQNPPVSIQGAVAGPGAVHTYQVRYRNSATFCTGEAWNSTNAIELTWSP